MHCTVRLWLERLSFVPLEYNLFSSMVSRTSFRDVFHEYRYHEEFKYEDQRHGLDNLRKKVALQ